MRTADWPERVRASIPVIGVGASETGITRGLVEFFFKVYNNEDHHYIVQALIYSRITQTMPDCIIDRSRISFLKQLPNLADPSFHIPSDIDILLGSDYLGHFLVDDRTLHDKHDGALFAQNTSFGWVIVGPIRGTKARTIKTCVTLVTHIELDKRLQRFWELEELQMSSIRKLEEDACENHFSLTHRRTENGRYIVKLPFHQPRRLLGDSKTSAMRSLVALERRFNRSPELQQQYLA